MQEYSNTLLHPSKSLVIGIGGVSRAGKSTLASLIASFFLHDTCLILCQDDFIRPLSEIPRVRDHVDWEDPYSIDFDKLYSSIIQQQTKYGVIIVEGLFAFNNESINHLFNFGYFIKIKRREFFHRKRLDLTWGAEPEWYIHHIWKSYLKYGRTLNNISPLFVLDGNKPFDKHLLLSHLQRFI